MVVNFLAIDAVIYQTNPANGIKTAAQMYACLSVIRPTNVKIEIKKPKRNRPNTSGHCAAPVSNLFSHANLKYIFYSKLQIFDNHVTAQNT